jgi:DNA-directed RNA polymerase subunit RPC12/RpoP
MSISKSKQEPQGSAVNLKVTVAYFCPFCGKEAAKADSFDVKNESPELFIEDQEGHCQHCKKEIFAAAYCFIPQSDETKQTPTETKDEKQKP